MGDRMEAVGTVLKAGRTPTVCGLEVFDIRGDRRKLVANGQQSPIRVARP
jgi:acyl-coenzyme A thioesterase PaaI-like protein